MLPRAVPREEAGEEVVATERRPDPAYDLGVVDVAGHRDDGVGGAVVPLVEAAHLIRSGPSLIP